MKWTDVISGSFKCLNPPEIKGSGYILKTFEAALWAFYNSNSFEEGCLKVVNLGEDADTTGAVYGQLAMVHKKSRQDGFQNWLIAI